MSRPLFGSKKTRHVGKSTLACKAKHTVLNFIISGFERIFHNPSDPITIKTHNTTKNNLWRLWELYKEGDIFWVWGKMSQGLLGGQYGFSLLVDRLVQLRVQNKLSNVDLIWRSFPEVRARRGHFGSPRSGASSASRLRPLVLSS